MPLTVEKRKQVASELKRFVHDLNLTDQQKERLHFALGEAREKLAEYLKKSPNPSRAEVISKVKEHRAEIRQRVASFLSPEQLTKWDAEAAKTKEFLGHRLEA